MDIATKHIALVCFSSSLGGLELSSLHLAQSLQGKGVSTLLVLPPSSPLEERARASHVDVAVVPSGWKYFDVRTAWRLYRLFKEKNIDIVILMRSEDINIASITKVLLPSLRLVFYQQMQSRHNKRDLIHTWVYSKLSLWISLTKRMKEDVSECTRVPKEKIRVIPLGTDLRRFDPAHFDGMEARRYFELPEGKRIIGVLGRLDPGKGQDVLLRAIPMIVAEHPDVLILIVGDETAGEPGHKKYLEGLSRTLGVEQYVKFMKFTDDVPRLLAALDIFTMPSFCETFGLVVIEAMAMEKPVIATNAGGVPELITDGQTGLLVEPRDERSLGLAIRRVLSDDHLRRSLARQGHAEAHQRFDFNVCVDTLIAELVTLT
jgi:D-inositol-3-phosphate glycosyltransferase